jgi:hypothetical protein
MALVRAEPTIFSKIERTSSVVVALLILYRTFLNTQLDILLLSGITLMAVFYLWSGFFLFTNALPLDIVEKGKRAIFTPFRITVSIGMGFVYSVSLISILYAYFFYPQMQLMLSFSFLLILISTCLVVLYHYFNKDEYVFVKQFYKRSVILGLFIFLIIVIPLETRLEILYHKHPGFIEAYIEYHQNPDTPEAIDKLRSERSKFR